MVIGTMTECVVKEQKGSFQNQSTGCLKRRASLAAISSWTALCAIKSPKEIPMLQLKKVLYACSKDWARTATP